MNKTAKYAIGGVVLASVVGLAVVAANKNKTKATEVRVEAVEARDLVASVTASGQIQPRTKVDVSADVTGKIVRLVVQEGQMVTRGQLLLQIDPEQATAAMQRAEATLASARAQAAQARAN
ncbi:MAG: biotin/lipoyl-binding protein, partial [Gemmatimonas sp.]